MKVLDILQSTAARSIGGTPPSNAKLYGGNLVRAIDERYGFLESPKRVSDFDYKKGLKFLEGMFEGHLIDMEVFESGVKAHCRGGTDICDAFIDDLIGAAQGIGVLFEESSQLRVYSSALEFELDGNFDQLFARLNVLGGVIGGHIASYGGPREDYRGIGLTFVGRLEGPAPDPFRIERRVDHPMDSKIFFSMAPLRNSDHVSVLRELERLIS